MPHTNRKSILLAAVLTSLVAGHLRAQLSVGAGGFGPLTFDTMPAASQFETTFYQGYGGTFTDAMGTNVVDADIIASAYANFGGGIYYDSTVPPVSFYGGFVYNTNGHYLQTRPTTGTAPNTNAATVLVGHFRNDSGAPISAFTLSYTFNVYNAATGELPGLRTFYSLTGASGSWTLMPSLSGTEAVGTQSGSVNLGTNWLPGQTNFILWVDDNANGVTDPGYTLDDMRMTITTVVQSPTIVTQPASTNVNEYQTAQLSVAATGADLTYQWYRLNPATTNWNAVSGATNLSVVVTNIQGDWPFPWSNPADSGNYRVIITGSVAPPATSSVATVTVTPDTVNPTFLYALGGPGTFQMRLFLSEPLDNSEGFLTDFANWTVSTLDGTAQLAISSVAYANTTITFTLDDSIPSEGNKGYEIKLLDMLYLHDLARTPNVLQDPAFARVYCFTNPVPVLDTNQVWAYHDLAVDLGPAGPTVEWSGLSYNDSAWASGHGIFDAKRAGDLPPHCRSAVSGLAVGTCINLSNATATAEIPTAYFRTHFIYHADVQAPLVLRAAIDDSAVLYLNGSELTRIRMPAGPITYATLGTGGGVTDAAFEEFFVYPTPGQLRAGDNLMAAEVHQINLTSSDLTFGLQVLRLSAETPSAPALSALREVNGASAPTGRLILHWAPAVGTLRSSTNLALPAASWTVEGTTQPVTVPATNGEKFFRVTLP